MGAIQGALRRAGLAAIGDSNVADGGDGGGCCSSCSEVTGWRIARGLGETQDDADIVDDNKCDDARGRTAVPAAVMDACAGLREVERISLIHSTTHDRRWVCNHRVPLDVLASQAEMAQTLEQWAYREGTRANLLSFLYSFLPIDPFSFQVAEWEYLKERTGNGAFSCCESVGSR